MKIESTLLKQLKIVNGVTIYSNRGTWHIYQELVSPLIDGIVVGEIPVTKVEYAGGIEETLHPYTKRKSWGSNLDVFIVEVEPNLNCSLEYRQVWDSNFFSDKKVFKVHFNFPDDALVPNSILQAISKKFRGFCETIRGQELKEQEEKEIKRIAEQLLTTTK